MKYYVRHPLGPLGPMVHCIRVLGANDARGSHEFECNVVPRGRVIEVTGAPVPAISKWLRNFAIEVYDEKKHVDAILESPPKQRPPLPAWVAEEEERRKGKEIEDEMAFEAARRGRW
jgi:hypothetical protein